MIKGTVVDGNIQDWTIALDNNSVFKINKEDLPESLRAVGARISLALRPEGGAAPAESAGPGEARELLNYLLQIS